MEEYQKKGKAGEGSKKGTKEKDKMRRRRERWEWKTGEEEKGWKEFREKREEEREKRKEERKKRGGRSKKNKNRESSARDAPFSPGAFPSTELGNHITPIKGRQGKNTTPTCKRIAALTPNLQKDPQQRRQGFCDSSYPVFVAHQRKRSIQSISPTAMKPLFIRKSKPSETSANVPNSPSINIKGVRTFSRKSEV